MIDSWYREGDGGFVIGNIFLWKEGGVNSANLDSLLKNTLTCSLSRKLMQEFVRKSVIVKLPTENGWRGSCCSNYTV